MITQCIPFSFKTELLKGLHDFSASGGHTFKIALYADTADLGTGTTVYTTTGEVTGTGYTAGGATLTVIEPSSSAGFAVVDFEDASWATATLSAKGALIYNSTSGNRAVSVLNFGMVKTVSAQTFRVTFPVANSTSAIIKIG